MPSQRVYDKTSQFIDAKKGNTCQESNTFFTADDHPVSKRNLLFSRGWPLFSGAMLVYTRECTFWITGIYVNFLWFMTLVVKAKTRN